MIKNQWYGILNSKELKHKPLGVKRMGEKLVLFRDKTGNPVCLVDSCCHRKAALSLGYISENFQLVCPFHGLEFNSKGECTKIPANGYTAKVPESFYVKSYPCKDVFGFIFIYYCDEIPALIPDVNFFDDLDLNMRTTTLAIHWKCFYTRAMENQLDVAHLPFIHHNTIGIGHATTVDGPGIEWINDHQMNVYIYNHKENGTLGKKPNEVPIPDPIKPFKLELIMPNLWQNYINQKMRIVAVFAPIDACNTIMYIRNYQSIIRTPILGFLFNQILRLMSYIIQGQDKRVVETQTPTVPELTGERLFMADKPIVSFRKKREELK